MEKLSFIKACLPGVRVIMAIMCVPLVELLCQVVMVWIRTLEYLLLGAHGSCGHVQSSQAVNATAY
jgi:hypothetical protein